MSSASHTPPVIEGPRWIPVDGDSMWPSLRAGDVAEVEPLVEAPRPGEVVLARFESALVLHRVRWCDGRVCALRGDNGGVEDPPLPLFRILGRARRVRRGGALLEMERWDVGPRALGRWRVALKRRLAAWLGRAGRA